MTQASTIADTEKGWMWKLACPHCGTPFTMAAPQSSVEGMTAVLHKAGQDAAIARNGTCAQCNQGSIMKFYLDENGKVTAVTVPKNEPGLYSHTGPGPAGPNSRFQGRVQFQQQLKKKPPT